MILLKLLAIFLAGVFDRKGGDDNLGFGKNADRFLSALCVSYIVGFDLWWHYLIFAIAHTAAMALAYATPWYNALFDQDDGPKQLLIRGLKGVLILFPVCWWFEVYSPLLAIVLGFVVSPYLSRYLFEGRYAERIRESRIYQRYNLKRKERWNLAELIRGWIIGLTNWVL